MSLTVSSWGSCGIDRVGKVIVGLVVVSGSCGSHTDSRHVLL